METQDNTLHFNLQRFADTGEAGSGEQDTTAKTEVKDGFVLVCAGGFPLGWAKSQRGTLKNKYLPGWRMM